MAKVKLKHKILGIREFEKEHADRILGMSKNGGWELAKTESNGKNRGSETD